MRVIQVIAGIGHTSSGTSTVVPRMCETLADAGCEVELHAQNPLPERQMSGVCVVGHNLSRVWPSRLGVSGDMRRALRESCVNADIIQTNGLWMFPNIYPDAARRGTKCKFVIMPHGTLNPWALQRSRAKKWVALHFFGQQGALVRADMFVATCEKEYHEIRACGFRQPVAIIPMGVDVPESVVSKTLAGSRKLIFMGRLHPVKRVDALVRIWRELQEVFKDWELQLAGPIDAYGEELQRMAQSIGCERCRFVGEVMGEKKDHFYQQGDLFVLPSHTENFGAVVAEALANGTPAIATKGAPWQGLVDHQCGLWIDVGDVPLREALEKIMMLPPSSLAEMGIRGRQWALRDFSWQCVGVSMRKAYEWLCNAGKKPKSVRID